MKIAPKTQPPNGYSLIELTAALSIFGFGVIGAMELFAVSTQATTTSLNYTQAIFLAEGVLEETIAEGSFIDSTNNGAFGNNYPNHAWETTIEETNQLGLFTIQATVKWAEKGKQKQYTLTTLAADQF